MTFRVRFNDEEPRDVEAEPDAHGFPILEGYVVMQVMVWAHDYQFHAVTRKF